MFEELPQLRGHNVDPRRDADDGRRAEQRDGLQKDNDEAAHDGWSGQWQRHPAHGGDGTRPQNIGSVFHLGRDQVEGRFYEQEDEREGMQRDHRREAREGVDVDQRVLGAGDEAPGDVEEARIRPRQQDPADGTQVGGQHEGRHHHRPAEALPRHIRARDRPGHRHRDHRCDAGREQPELERVEQRIQISLPAIGGSVVLEREDAIARLEAHDQQLDERKGDKKGQGEREAQPQRHDRLEIAQPRRPAGTRRHGARQDLIRGQPLRPVRRQRYLARLRALPARRAPPRPGSARSGSVR